MFRLFPDPPPLPRRARIDGFGGDNLAVRRNREHVVVGAADGNTAVLLVLTATEARNAASVLRDFADEVLTPPEADPFDACRGLTDEERDAYRAPVPAPVDGERHRV